MMDEALLAALLVGWAAVLLPSALKSRRETDPQVTVGGFTEAMAVLRGRPDGREIMVPGQPERIVGQGPPGNGRPGPAPGDPRPVVAAAGGSRRADLLERRRTLFVRLLAATGGTFVLALIVGGLLWPLFFTTTVALGGYVAMLRHFKVEADQARAVVRTLDLPGERVPRDPGPDLYREPVAVGGGGEYGAVQVATSPDTPWEPQSSVRIRRWDT